VQLSELLELPLRDAAGQQVGTVVDVRLAIGGDLDDRPDEPALFGLIISPHTQSSYLGYERSDARRPTLLAALLRWRHRGTFLTLWHASRVLAPSRSYCGRASSATRRCCATMTNAPPVNTKIPAEFPAKHTGLESTVVGISRCGSTMGEACRTLRSNSPQRRRRKRHGASRRHSRAPL